MGRLVDPISHEEFERLPKWQQWISNHWYFVVLVAIAAIAASALIPG